jgi:hypothetical protein
LERTLAQLDAHLGCPCHVLVGCGQVPNQEGEVASRDLDRHSMSVPLRAPLQDQTRQPSPVSLPEHKEEVLRLGEEAHRCAWLGRGGPLDRGAYVPVVRRPLFQQSDRARRHPRLLGRNADRREMVQMLRPRGSQFVGGRQLLGCVFAHGLQEPVARAPLPSGNHRDQ